MSAKTSISWRALEARVRRHMASDGIALRKCRETSRDYDRLGDYFAIDVSGNSVVGRDIDLAAYAREKGLIKGWEQVVADE